MISFKTTLSALIDYSILYEKDTENLDLIESALKMKILFSGQSVVLLEKAAKETSRTHTIAEEIAARRLQVAARYLLEKHKIEKLFGAGVVSEAERSKLLRDLHLKHNREKLFLELSRLPLM